MVDSKSLKELQELWYARKAVEMEILSGHYFI